MLIRATLAYIPRTFLNAETMTSLPVANMKGMYTLLKLCSQRFLKILLHTRFAQCWLFRFLYLGLLSCTPSPLINTLFLGSLSHYHGFLSLVLARLALREFLSSSSLLPEVTFSRIKNTFTEKQQVFV